MYLRLKRKLTKKDRLAMQIVKLVQHLKDEEQNKLESVVHPPVGVKPKHTPNNLI